MLINLLEETVASRQKLRGAIESLNSKKRTHVKLQTKTEHPYVEINPKVCNGSPVIVGTRIRIVDIAIEYEYMNCTPDDIVNAHPHLKLEQIHDALSYYYEHRSEIDKKK